MTVFLLIANFFFGLIGYFMANMGYALGDIKMNSLINIVKGVVCGVLFYLVTKPYGIVGLLVVMLTASICIDFIFFTYRLHKLGFLNLAFMRRSLSLWAIIIPVAAVGGWGFSVLFNTVIPESMYIIKILLNGFSFTVFFGGLVLLLDSVLRNALTDTLYTVFKINFNKQTVVNE